MCVNKNEQWKTKAALCSSLCREREQEGVCRERERERERGYNGQDSKGFEGGEITGDERENVRREREKESRGSQVSQMLRGTEMRGVTLHFSVIFQ